MNIWQACKASLSVEEMLMHYCRELGSYRVGGINKGEAVEMMMGLGMLSWIFGIKEGYETLVMLASCS